MTLLDSWTLGEHSADDKTFPTYRKGGGPGVVLIHELPGMTPDVIALAEDIVAAGFTVVMPLLFNKPETGINPVSFGRALRRVCVSNEFTKLATGETTPMAEWLRSLARSLSTELGGPVGALGMCFTGGFALAMMVDESVGAPVVAQPSAPFAIGKARAADVNLSPADLARVKERVAGGCQVLGLRFAKDLATGTRFDTLTRELGDGFIRVEFPGAKHGTLTQHRQQAAVDRVLSFFQEKLT